MLNKINLTHFENAKTHKYAEEMAEHLNTSFTKHIENISSSESHTYALVQQAISRAKSYDITSGRYLTLYIIVTFLLGFKWEKDPQFSHLYLILTDTYDSNDTRFGATLHHVSQEHQHLVEIIPNIQKVLLEIIESPAKIATAMYTYYIDILIEKRSFINPVDKNLLIERYVGLFNHYFPAIEPKDIEDDEWWEDILSDDWKSQEELEELLIQKKLIYIGLSLCYGMYFLENKNYQQMLSSFDLNEKSFTQLTVFLRNNITQLGDNL